MKLLSSILAVVDRSSIAPGALRKACTLARLFGARLQLFLCDSEHAYALRHSYDRSGIPAAREACLTDARQFLDRLRRSLGEPGVEIDVDAACESPLHEGIVRHVLATRPDVVVKSLGSFLTIDDWHLIRTCPVPLLLMRERPWSGTPTFAAAVDVSDDELPGLARDIVQAAGFLARAAQGELYIVHGATARAPEIEQSLRELAAEFHVAPERVHLLHGDPTARLPRWAAERGYDVVALGALTHRSALTPVVGTLTERLVDALACDMLFIKPCAFECPVCTTSTAPRPDSTTRSLRARDRIDEHDICALMRT